MKAEEWLGKKGAWDNSYEATFGSSGWGAGAQAILGQVSTKKLHVAQLPRAAFSSPTVTCSKGDNDT